MSRHVFFNNILVGVHKINNNKYLPKIIKNKIIYKLHSAFENLDRNNVDEMENVITELIIDDEVAAWDFRAFKVKITLGTTTCSPSPSIIMSTIKGYNTSHYIV